MLPITDSQGNTILIDEVTGQVVYDFPSPSAGQPPPQPQPTSRPTTTPTATPIPRPAGPSQPPGSYGAAFAPADVRTPMLIYPSQDTDPFAAYGSPPDGYQSDPRLAIDPNQLTLAQFLELRRQTPEEVKSQLAYQAAQTALLQGQLGQLGQSSGNASAAVSRQNALDQLAEQQRQFNERLWNDKAAFNAQQALTQQQQAQNQLQNAQQYALQSAQFNQQIDDRKKQYELQLRQQGLSEQEAKQRADQFAQSLALQQAGLTGTYNGQQTFAAQQAAQQNALAAAGLTGTYGGAPTLAAQQAAQQQALAAAGLTGSYNGAPTIAAQQLAQQGGQFGQSLAEQQRQFNAEQALAGQKFGLESELGRGGLALQQRQQEIGRGNTLLSLGSRPDTLTRYLYALRGEQVPQGAASQPLPGYEDLALRTTAPQVAASRPQLPRFAFSFPGIQAPTTSAPLSVPPPAAQPVSYPNLPSYVDAGGQAVVPGFVNGAIPASRVGQVGSEPGNLGFIPPGPSVGPVVSTPIGRLVAPVAGATFNRAAGGQVSWAVPGRTANALEWRDPQFVDASEGAAYSTKLAQEKALRPPPLEYARGGVIPEPVAGRGMVSGQMYTFGEEGPEEVKPAEEPYKLPDLKRVQKLLDEHHRIMADLSKAGMTPQMVMGDEGVDRSSMMGPNSYASGGTIGYDPTKFAPPSLFNPAALARSPFPQIDQFTGGTSYIPSAQRLSQATPTERSLYAGYLTDEVGLPAEDVLDLSRKLSPTTSGLRTLRFAN